MIARGRRRVEELKREEGTRRRKRRDQIKEEYELI
jgi:hypothetical protein